MKGKYSAKHDIDGIFKTDTLFFKEWAINVLRAHLLHLLVEVGCVVLLRSFRAVGFASVLKYNQNEIPPVKEDEHEEDPVALLDAVLGEALDEPEARPQVALVDRDDQGDPGVLGDERHRDDFRLR